MTTKKKMPVPTGFVGRREILSDIYKHIDEGETAIVLKGPAGVGKTALLHRVIAHLEKKKYDVLFLPGLLSPESVLETIAQKAAKKLKDAESIYSSPIEYKQKLEQLLENYVYKEKILFVFDDFDENQDSEGAFLNQRLKELLTYLKDSLKDKNSLMIFCTYYDIPKFTTTEIPPLPWQEFLEMIRTTSTLKKLDKKSLEYFHFEIGGFPRAVELCDAIAQQEFSEQSFDWAKLRARVPGLAERIQHKESETADFSYLLLKVLLGYLNDKQRHIVDTLAVYKKPANRDMLEAQNLDLTPHDRKKLEKLALLSYPGGRQTGHYQLPRLTAQLIYAQLPEQTRKQKHLQAAGYYSGRDNIEARRHYIDAEHIDDAMSMTLDMDRHYCAIGFPQLAFDLLTGMEKHTAQMNDTQRLQLAMRLGMFHSLFGQLDNALEQHQTVLKLNEAGDNNTTIAAAVLAQIGMIHEAKGKYDDALKHFQQSLEASEKTGDTAAIAQRLHQIGTIQKLQGNYEQALENYQRALEINRRRSDQKAIAANLEQLGRIHDEQRKFDEALDYYTQSLDIKQTLEDRQGASDLLHQMGNVNFVKSSIDKALDLYRQSLNARETINDHKGAGYSLGQIGLILQKKGDIDGALSHYEKSLENFEKADEKKGIAASHHQIGRIHESRNNLEKALEHYQKAVEIREETGDMLGAAITYGQLGMLYYAKKEYETALTYSTKAFAIFSQYGSPNMELARKNMLRIRHQIPIETFNAVLREYNINPEPGQPAGTGEETKQES
jgi:tetratricopeptide (TPR) repeat protein